MGHFNLEIVPCTAKGKDYKETDDVWVDNPEDLIGGELYFNVKLNSARGLPSRYTVSRTEAEFKSNQPLISLPWIPPINTWWCCPAIEIIYFGNVNKHLSVHVFTGQKLRNQKLKPLL